MRRAPLVVLAALAAYAVVTANAGGALPGSEAPAAPRAATGPAQSTAAKSARPTVEDFAIHSALLHRSLSEILVLPAGARADGSRPLLMLLHGRSATPAGWLQPGFFAGLRDAGPRAPDVLLVNGGDHSYYHDRADGPWGAYVIREAIPAGLRRSGADPHRLAIGGISMGGFGAFDIARLNPGRFCAIGGHSAALWENWPDSAPGAFDDAGDFARHDVIAAARRNRHLYGGARIWLDGGYDDPFRSADEDLAAALGVTMHHWPGGHDGAYWDAHMERYLAFYSAALAARSCHGGYRPRAQGGATGPTGATGPAGPVSSTGTSNPSGGASPGA